MFDFTALPEKGEKVEDNDTWTISFAYRIYFDRPTACTMWYQNVIHNQLLDQKFRPSKEEHPAYALEDHQRQFAYSLGAYEWLSHPDQNGQKRINQGYQIPDFDEWIPERINETTSRLYTMLILIENQAPGTQLVNLFDPEEVALTKNVAAFLKKEWSYITREHKSVFQLSLYENKTQLGDWAIRVDDQCNVYLDAEMDMRKTYRLRLSFYHDLSELDDDAKERLDEDPAGEDIKKAIDPDKDPTLPTDPWIDKDDDPNKRRSIKTVETLIIEVMKHGTRRE